MVHRLALLVLLLLSGLACAAGVAAADEEDLPTALARLVDMRVPANRQDAADALAERDDVTLGSLLLAMRSFGSFEAVEPGPHVADVALPLRRTAHTVVYVPKGYDPKTPAPLLVALHGAGGRGAEMIPWWRALADEMGMLVVAPSEAGENQGFRFSVDERADVLAVLRWTRRRYNIDENRVHLTGISRGGHLTWDVGMRHPDRWASLSPMIGGPRLNHQEGQNNLRYVENVAHLPIRDLQGRDDDSMLIFNLGLAFRRLEAAGAKDAELLLQSGHGHGFDFEAVDWKAFLSGAVRTPVPPRVVRLAAREGEGRAFWVEIVETTKTVAESFTLKVSPTRWNALDEAGKRLYVQREADKRTARLEARFRERGRIEIKAAGAKRVRVLLNRDMFDPEERVEVLWNGRRYRRKVTASKQVLLREFAERFDRTFLPVVEVRVP